MERLVEGGLLQTLCFDKAAALNKALSFYGISVFADFGLYARQSVLAKRRGNYGLEFGWLSHDEAIALEVQPTPWLGWLEICAAPNDDIYAIADMGTIYKQTAGIGPFVDLLTDSWNWSSLCAAPNGDIYATVSSAVGDIYKQTGGEGAFVALNAGMKNWTKIRATLSGDLYALAYNDYIYKQTGGVGDFVAVSSLGQVWSSLCIAPNGDVYATAELGSIYKQTGGVGDFAAQTVPEGYWASIAAAPNGDIYAAMLNTDIYKQTGGEGAFVAQNAGDYSWGEIGVSDLGDVYALAPGVDIYKQTGGVGDFVALQVGDITWKSIIFTPNNRILIAATSTDIYQMALAVFDSNYVYQSVGDQDDFWFRFYFNIHASFAIPDSAGGQGIFLGCIMNDAASMLVAAYLDRNVNTYELNFQHGAWGSWGIPAGAVRVAVNKSTWHCLELHFKKDAAVGGSEVWLDDNLLYSDLLNDSSSVTPSQWLIGSNFTSVVPVADSKLFVADVAVSNIERIGLQAFSSPITLESDALPIASDGAFNFGAILVGADSLITFTLNNDSDASVSLVGIPKVSVLSGSANYTIDTQPVPPSIIPGGSATFILRFAPTGVAGARIASISIPYVVNKSDPFSGNLVFEVQGYAVVQSAGGNRRIIYME